MLRYLSLILALPTAALADGIRDSDTRLDPARATALLGGNVVEFFDGSTARYGGDGSYGYRYRPQDPPFVGTYAIGEGGEVCVIFDNGFDRCDTFVLAGDRLVLIIADGTRFPAREVRPE